MSERNMLPIQSILNHSPPMRSETPFTPQRSGSELSSPASEVTEFLAPATDGHVGPKTKKTRNSSDLSYTKPQGIIRYPPYENLDTAAYNLMASFNIIQFGQIAQWSAHIPYSSDKKDVFEKTGRESFHIFVYTFTDPSTQQTYDVMWDWDGGFVRISPFFKSMKHKKTGPAKMLDLNKGLREVTIQMTGGNRVAQGYWMPYQCARAACATFCYPIAGALIPIFGPSFPQECIRPDSPRFGRMIIDEHLIREAKQDITVYKHTNLLSQRNNVLTSHPRPDYKPFDGMRHVSIPYPRFDNIYSDPRNGHPMNNYYKTTQPPRPPPWSSSPDRGDLRISHRRSPTWTPINSAVKNESSQRGNPHLRPTQRPTILNSELTLAPYKRSRLGDEDTYRRDDHGDQRDYKRPKLVTESVERCETVARTQTTNKAGTPAPETRGDTSIKRETRVTPTLKNLMGSWDEEAETKVQTKEERQKVERKDYSAEDLQAAAILANITPSPRDSSQDKNIQRPRSV